LKLNPVYSKRSLRVDGVTSTGFSTVRLDDIDLWDNHCPKRFDQVDVVVEPFDDEIPPPREIPGKVNLTSGRENGRESDERLASERISAAKPFQELEATTSFRAEVSQMFL
jgi:hypothetical protein